MLVLENNQLLGYITPSFTKSSKDIHLLDLKCTIFYSIIQHFFYQRSVCHNIYLVYTGLCCTFVRACLLKSSRNLNSCFKHHFKRKNTIHMWGETASWNVTWSPWTERNTFAIYFLLIFSPLSYHLTAFPFLRQR